MYRMVEEFRSLKDAVAGLQLMQTMWLESIFHADSGVGKTVSFCTHLFVLDAPQRAVCR